MGSFELNEVSKFEDTIVHLGRVLSNCAVLDYFHKHLRVSSLLSSLMGINFSVGELWDDC
jgi:hypothetical protein